MESNPDNDHGAGAPSEAEAGVAARQRWMGVLARADPATLGKWWHALAEPPAYDRLRGPEVGLVMVRGRAGGTGGAFNLGEMTVTRCTVRLAGGTVGHAYVAGRDGRHAEIAAVCDALMQERRSGGAPEGDLIADLKAAEAARRYEVRAKAAATRVDFFTLVRGDD